VLSGVRTWDLRPIWIGFASLILLGAALELVLLFQIIDNQESVGIDLRYFQSVAQRWLDTGVYYTERELSGPFHVETLVDNLYPPLALFLFVPFLYLPAILWWVIPLGVIAYVVWWCRPVTWALPILALTLLFPKTPAVILYGNSDIWVTAFAAAGVRWAWPAVLVAFKPSLVFFAAIGVLSRHWWIAAVIVGIVNLSFLALWVDYAKVITHSDTSMARSLGDLPFLLLPIAAWLLSSRRGDTSWRAWAGKLLRADRP